VGLLGGPADDMVWVGASASNKLESVRRWRGEADVERDGGRELMSGHILKRKEVEKQVLPVGLSAIG
jgi:hypothetical protein